MKTLVVTEKKSVADDFAKVLGGFSRKETRYERDDMIIAWASGHLLELQDPSAYDSRYKRWALSDLPIIPDSFTRVPRADNARGKELLADLVKQMRRQDVDRVVNACDAGREGELIFNLIADHASVGGKKSFQRLWLQSMTAGAIRQGFDDLRPAAEFQNLRDAAYARDEADWIVGMNGTRAFTKKFMGRARQFFAVGRVKTPTLAFLVDREREIDAFRAEPYFQIDAVFDTGRGTYSGRWNGPGEDGRKGDRLARRESAEAILARLRHGEGFHPGQAAERHTRKSEIAPLLFDLTAIQREASSRFGYTLDRTLSICQSLYEQRKAITYPRTSSRYLPGDYEAEVPRLVESLRGGELGHVAAAAIETAGGVKALRPVRKDRVFNDKKVSDHFALIPTGENPTGLRDDERRLYELIVRRFLAVFLPPAVWDNVQRETTVAGEVFVTRDRRLAERGWRAVEPLSGQKDLPPIPEGGRVATQEVELLEKETAPPPRYTDGTLVKAMETAHKVEGRPEEEGEPALDDEVLEELKEKGIGTPATRAAIVKDLIQKRLARRQGRNILPTPLGCTLVRLVRNLDLGVLAKPDLTGDWEYRLTLMAHGSYGRDEWNRAIRQQVADIVSAVKDQEAGNERIFRLDHPGPLSCPSCGGPLHEKTFSYLCTAEGCEWSLSKDQKGKYLFPETVDRLLKERRVGPLTGFEGTRAAGYLILEGDGQVAIELAAAAGDEEEADGQDEPDQAREQIPDGTVVGRCPKCGSPVVRDGKGYRCEKNIPRKKDKECDFRLAERIKYRYLPLAQIKRMLSGEKTDELFGFVSMRGKKFKARLFYDKGELQWEFPPRKTAKKAGKKASKKAARKAASRTEGGDAAE